MGEEGGADGVADSRLKIFDWWSVGTGIQTTYSEKRLIILESNWMIGKKSVEWADDDDATRFALAFHFIWLEMQSQDIGLPSANRQTNRTEALAPTIRKDIMSAGYHEINELK